MQIHKLMYVILNLNPVAQGLLFNDFYKTCFSIQFNFNKVYCIYVIKLKVSVNNITGAFLIFPFSR